MMKPSFHQDVYPFQKSGSTKYTPSLQLVSQVGHGSTIWAIWSEGRRASEEDVQQDREPDEDSGENEHGQVEGRGQGKDVIFILICGIRVSRKGNKLSG